MKNLDKKTLGKFPKVFFCLMKKNGIFVMSKIYFSILGKINCSILPLFLSKSIKRRPPFTFENADFSLNSTNRPFLLFLSNINQ